MHSPLWYVVEFIVAASLVVRGAYAITTKIRDRRDEKEDRRREAEFAEARRAQRERERPESAPVDLTKRSAEDAPDVLTWLLSAAA